MTPTAALDDLRVHVKIKLAALWIAAIQSTLDGKMGLWAPSRNLRACCVMVFLCTSSSS